MCLAGGHKRILLKFCVYEKVGKQFKSNLKIVYLFKVLAYEHFFYFSL